MIPKATTNLKDDMSKPPFDSDQRMYLYITTIITLGVLAFVYILKH